jgi:hypothetical protein
MQQLAREREALNGAYVDLQASMDSDVAKAAEGSTRPLEEAIPELLGLTAKLANFVNMEREHSDKLYTLLLDAMRRLAQSHDIELPEDWPGGGGGTVG